MTYSIVLYVCFLGTNPSTAPCQAYHGLELFPESLECELSALADRKKLDLLLAHHGLEAFAHCRPTRWMA